MTPSVNSSTILSLKNRVLLIPWAIANCQKWQQEGSNIMLHFLGGAVGIRKIVSWRK
jgi:hypothetical protein